MKNEVCKLRE
jgi:hypothetical protein